MTFNNHCSIGTTIYLFIYLFMDVTVAAKLKVLARSPSEVSAQAKQPIEGVNYIFSNQCGLSGASGDFDHAKRAVLRHLRFSFSGVILHFITSPRNSVLL